MSKITLQELSSELREHIQSAGGSMTFSTYRNTVTLNGPTDRVSIGIDKFDTKTDTLLVYKDTDYLHEGTNYTASNTEIVSTSEEWKAGSNFNFIVLKNSATPAKTFSGTLLTDDSVTNDKLAANIKVGNLNHLATTEKSNIVAAINEVKKGGLEFGTKREAGKFYRSNEAPTSTNDLKYDGHFSATRIYNAVFNDYAEYFEKEDLDEVIEYGHVIVTGENGGFTKSQKAYDSNVVGVVSNEYAFCIGGEGKEKNELEKYLPIGLAGRVQVKVKGPIKKGNLLVTSELPGVACKMEDFVPGTVIGKALEDKEDEAVGLVRILIMCS